MTIISNIDFHCHTTASDGGFSPTAVVERAFARGLNYLAITDHDLVLGIDEALQHAQACNLRLLNNKPDALAETFIKSNAVVEKVENGVLQREPQDRLLTIIPGIELSATWNDEQVHIVGLFIDHHHPCLTLHIEKQRQSRVERALAISKKLESLGFERPYERCCEKAQVGASITRGNYARFIYEDGQAKSIDEAFNKYLKKGAKAYVKTIWSSVEDTVKVIKEANGVAVLAHPRRYKLSNQRLRRLIEHFIACGGEAIEVSSSQQKPKDREYLQELCHRYQIMASLGSDFHNEGIYRDLGQNLDLDSALTPVWHHEKAIAFKLNSEVKQRLVHITYKKEVQTESLQ